MKHHSSLIKKYISVNDTPENIAQKLIVKTCEIEEIIERKISDSIVIWYIKSYEKHPDADKLNVCMVDCGNKGEYQIICGWSNVKEGLYVPVALPGTVFPKAGITIEKRIMRWIESNGMICSKEELDINEDQELHSIWDLALDLDDISETDLGTPISDKFPWLNSYVYEVDNKGLTNRPDLTGHFGLAVELNAMYRDPASVSFNKISEWMKHFHDTNILQTFEHATPAKRKVIWQSDKLNTYTLLEINNIEIKTLSFYTRLQLLDLGANPRNNRVDFSNLFMLLTGQPIHFFDADKVDGDIIVRNAKDGEEFVDLFETKHILKDTDMVIADKNKILALAWVVWWLDSGISDSTKNVLVEIANFDPVSVRKTWTRLGLRTDAELRYEKNINPWWSMYCLLLFLDELKYYAKDLGNFDLWGISYYLKENLTEPKAKEIHINLDEIEQQIFGKKIDNFAPDAQNILQWLGFITKDSVVTCPIRRSPDDLNIQADITEEIIRIYGYEHVDGLPVLSDIQHTPYSPYVNLIRTLEDIFVQDFYFDQTETYPRISQKQLEQFWKNRDNCYSLQNPVHVDTPYLRDNMVYNLLAHVSKNSKFFDTFRIFDIGNIWQKKENSGETDKYASSFVDESLELWAFVYQKSITNWDTDPFLSIKSLLQPLLQRLGISGTLLFKANDSSSFHPKKQAIIFVGDIEIGTISSIHPLLLKEYKIPETAGLCYLWLSLPALHILQKQRKKTTYHYETLQDQIVWRDLCFVIDTTESFESILRKIKSTKEVEWLEIFDVYEGKNLGEGKKSISLKIKITWDGNLTTEKINEVMNKTISGVEKIWWKLRE